MNFVGLVNNGYGLCLFKLFYLGLMKFACIWVDILEMFAENGKWGAELVGGNWGGWSRVWATIDYSGWDERLLLYIFGFSFGRRGEDELSLGVFYIYM